jgi:hypothetical protein
MNDIDEFAASLLEEAKRFLEKAKSSEFDEAMAANLHAALLLTFCSLEAHINAIADEFSARSDISVHERGIITEREVHLVNGRFELNNKLRMWRMEDRIEVLHQRLSKAGELDLAATWRQKLGGAIDLRNKLTHPKSVPQITIASVERAVEAVIETIDALYRAIYGRKFPAAGLGLASKLDF